MSGEAARGRSTPVIGRTAELATLFDIVIRPPVVAFVEGEAGAGKTTLIGALAAAMRGRNRWMTVGTCQPLDEPFPYGPLLDCLGRAGDRVDSPDPVTGALRGHLPELADLLPPAPPPLERPEAERHRMFRAVCALVRALGPVVLVVEDVHWADDDTRQVLRFLLADPPPGLSLVMTYRREELRGDAPLGPVVRPPPEVVTRHLGLRPFAESEVRALIEAVTGGVVSESFATAVLHETGGIPYVVAETARALRERLVDTRLEGVAAGRVLATVDVPVLVRESVLERLHRLIAPERAVVEAAAVLGDAPAEILTAVAGSPGPRPVVNLVRSGVLTEGPPNRYGLRHEMARRAVYAALPGPRRRELHSAAVRVLAGVAGWPAARLAEHCAEAGMPQEWLRYSEKAADAAAGEKDMSLAVDVLSRVVSDRDAPAEDLTRLARKLCAYALTGLPDTDVIRRIEELQSDPRLAADVRGEVRLCFGTLLVRESLLDRGCAEIAHAIELLGDHPERIASGMALLSVPYLDIATAADHRVWLLRVEDLLSRLPGRPVRTAVLATVLGGQLIVGDPVIWDRIALLPAPEDIDDPAEIRHLARAYANLADACSWTGRDRQGRTFLHTGLAMASRAGADYVVATAEATSARLDWLAGEWSGLAERVQALIRVYSHLPHIANELNLVIGWLAAARGDWLTAERGFHSALDTHPTAVIPVAVAAAGGMAAMLLSRDDTAARAHAERGLALLREKGSWAWTAEIVPQAVACYLADDETDAARQLVAEAEEELEGIDAPSARLALTVCRAQVAAAAGDHDDAGRHYRDAQLRYDVLGQRYRAAQCADRAARITGADPSVFRELAVAFDALGATVDAARCRHHIRSTGTVIPSVRGRRSYGTQLSPREHDVARLLANGHTNREIAQALFISRRTVEDHVANVLRKLDASSRHDVRL
ncbi:ATP-binding protein [Amycolatopsis pittospori]|uniref:ATP-binding protein n=1 Tax=Amycolatopsis pittospori TaxID=2749434 RepID=UPI001A9FE2B5|nr:LuxR family transcriptional regulator [Amycolatopsis pittospori]